MKNTDTTTSTRGRRHATTTRPRRARRARRHALQQLLDSATRALAILRARGATHHAGARSFGAAISH